MSRQGFNKLQRFFEEKPYLRAGFIAKVQEGYSLRNLRAYLEGVGIDCNHETIRQYIERQNLQLREERKEAMEEKKKTGSVLDKVQEFFNTLRGTPSTTSTCQHHQWEERANLWTERIERYCKSCGLKIAERDMESDTTNKRLDEILYYGVMKETDSWVDKEKELRKWKKRNNEEH